MKMMRKKSNYVLIVKLRNEQIKQNRLELKIINCPVTTALEFKSYFKQLEFFVIKSLWLPSNFPPKWNAPIFRRAFFQQRHSVWY